MSSTRDLSIEQLAKALARLSPAESKSLIEILERENLKRRRTLVRHQITRRQVVSERALFKGLNDVRANHS